MATIARLGGPNRRGNRREIVTPEGVPLPVELADWGDRAAAVIVDIIIMFAVIFGLALLVGLGLAEFSMVGWWWAIVILIWFAVRSFYFIVFELRWWGTTPGKRIFGLRVIDRKGERLRADAVFARNLMREVEMFIPISLLLMSGQVGTGAWVNLLTLVWMSIFTLMPFFNKDRLRVGEIVGGTAVISAPKSVLLPDIAGTGASEPAAEASPALVFTKKQLEVYGIYELQTLESVLRKKGLNARRTQDMVCQRVQRKIRWSQEEPVDSRRFLEDFYTSLRAHLETRMLFGVRRESQHDRE